MAPVANDSNTLIVAKAAAFFDVDGTLIDSTIAHYFRYFMFRRLPPLRAKLWYAGFLVRCGYYMALDRVDRGRLNVVFYRNYAGLPAAEIKSQAVDCFQNVIMPRRFVEAGTCIEEHRLAGRAIVLVTGSLDFIIEPLATEVGAAGVIASRLDERDGRFTGELTGPPMGTEEKARRMREFGAANGIGLAQSHAYGDSAADLPMLEAVGSPHAVNPDRKLAAAARARGWPIHHWNVSLPPSQGGTQGGPFPTR
jgi:HAD superfamily hydrolase (TIGR01490 family)